MGNTATKNESGEDNASRSVVENWLASVFRSEGEGLTIGDKLLEGELTLSDALTQLGDLSPECDVLMPFVTQEILVGEGGGTLDAQGYLAVLPERLKAYSDQASAVVMARMAKFIETVAPSEVPSSYLHPIASPDGQSYQINNRSSGKMIELLRTRALELFRTGTATYVQEVGRDAEVFSLLAEILGSEAEARALLNDDQTYPQTDTKLDQASNRMQQYTKLVEADPKHTAKELSDAQVVESLLLRAYTLKEGI